MKYARMPIVVWKYEQPHEHEEQVLILANSVHKVIDCMSGEKKKNQEHSFIA